MNISKLALKFKNPYALGFVLYMNKIF